MKKPPKIEPFERRASRLSRVVGCAVDTLLDSWQSRIFPALAAEKAKLETQQHDREDFYADSVFAVELSTTALRNLLAAAIYHVLEQSVTALFNPSSPAFKLQAQTPNAKDKKKTDDTETLWYDGRVELSDSIALILRRWNIDISHFQSWDALKELQSVANCVKHGHGKAAAALMCSRPTWFVEDEPMLLPLAAEGIKVPESYLAEASHVVRSFLDELRGAFSAPQKG